VARPCTIFAVAVSSISVDTASSQPGDLVLPVTSSEQPTGSLASLQAEVPQNLMLELWRAAEAADCGLTCEEFSIVLRSVGERVNYGLPAGTHSDSSQRVAFFHSLRLSELAVAHACALGRDAAWQRFLSLYRDSLTRAAIAISGSATVGHELADSLYAELYGLRELDGRRRSPLASYSGRGSLLGWLRTTLAQRHIDYHRRTLREAPLDDVDPPAPATPGAGLPPGSAELARLTEAVSRSLEALGAEDRFMLCSYFLDRQTQLDISRVLHIHEATVSRRLKRLVDDLRKRLVHNLQSGGLSKRAAEEALGADPRDVELNLRALLQTSQTTPFSAMTAANPASEKR
jgi:RNA polymerase sigma-70 factor (ECF subfamily)